MNTKEEYIIIEALREANAIEEGPVSYEEVFRRYRGELKLTSVEREMRRMANIENSQIIRISSGFYLHRKLKGLNNLRGFV